MQEHQSVTCTFDLRAVPVRAQHSGLVGCSSYNLFCILVTKTLTLTAAVLCENTADDVEHATSLKITLTVFSQLVPNLSLKLISYFTFKCLEYYILRKYTLRALNFKPAHLLLDKVFLSNVTI